MPKQGFRTRPPQSLSDQEEAFARAYAIDPLATAAAAARSAGYAERGISVAANRLLKRPHIQARIAELTQTGVSRLNEAAKAAAKPAPAKPPRPAKPANPAKGAAKPAQQPQPQPPLPDPLPNDLIISLDRVIREVALIGFSNAMDFMKVDDNGLAYVDLSEMTRDQAAAIKEIKVEEFKVGHGEKAREAIRTTVKLSDKLPALLALGKHLGGFKEQVELDAKAGGALAEFIDHLRSIKRSALPVASPDWVEAEVIR